MSANNNMIISSMMRNATSLIMDIMDWRDIFLDILFEIWLLLLFVPLMCSFAMEQWLD